MPFAAIISFCGGKSRLEIAFGEKPRDDSVEHDGPKDFDRAIRLRNNEVNIATI